MKYDTYFFLFYIRIYCYLRNCNFRNSTYVQLSHNTVPVCLGMIGNTVGVHTDINVFNAIVNPYANVMIPCFEFPQIIFMGYSQCILHTDLFAIDPQCGFPMNTLQMQYKFLIAHSFGNRKSTVIPCWTYIVFIGL
ncbi:hypothetical protein D3C86_1742300 [compost metagenome]